MYNEEKLISHCLKSILDINYPKEDYEVVVVNDGSEDGTREAIRKYPVKLIDLKENQGRLIAREIGASSAKYDNLLFIDSRCMVTPDILERLSQIDEDVVVGNVSIDKERTPLDHFFYLWRKKYYGKYFDNDFEPLYITEENFDSIPKGTGVFFCKKNLFLSVQPKNKSKNVSDDTRLFHNILIKGGKILKHPKVLVLYQERSNLMNSLSHIYDRGRKFSDFYLRKGGSYYNRYLGINILLALFIMISIIYLTFFIIALLTAFVLYFIVPLYFVEKKGDYPVLFKYQGLVSLSFFVGIIEAKKAVYLPLILLSILMGVMLSF